MRHRFAIAIVSIVLLIGTMGLGPAPDGPAHLDSALSFPGDAMRMGGFSGIEVSADGRNAILISDRGRLLFGNFARENNRIVGFQYNPIQTLSGRDGAPVREKGNDSEGLTQGPDGALHISFEGEHRVLFFPPGQTVAERRFQPPLFARLPGNGGIEALAQDDQGHLYALTERSSRRDGRLSVFRGTGEDWKELAPFPRSKGFLPVGADVGPDRRLYVLERHFKGLGFASRVRSFRLTPEGLRDEQLVLRTPQRRHGNLEGLSVWQDSIGNLRLTMVSDNNFLSLLPNEVVEYVLPKPLANKASEH